MQLSDTTDYNGILQRCEHYTNLGLGTITGDTDLKKEFINHVNAAQHDMFIIAMEASDAWDVDDHKYSDRKVFTTPLTTNRDYTIDFSERILEWERIDVSWDSDEYFKANPIDTTEIPFGIGNDDDVDSNFDKEDPRYDTRGNQLLLYPKADQSDVDAGGEIRMEWTREANEFARDGTDDSKESFLPRAFHEHLAIRAAYKWLMVNKPENESLLSRIEAEIGRGTEAIEDHFNSRESDRQYAMSSAIDPFSYGR